MSKPKAKVKVNEAQILYLAQIGCTDEEIAVLAGVSESTLKRRFGPLLKEGRGSLRVLLRKAQIESARRGNVAMQIWLGKQYLGQRDRHDVITTERNLQDLSDDELRAIAGLED